MKNFSTNSSVRRAQGSSKTVLFPAWDHAIEIQPHAPAAEILPPAATIDPEISTR